MVTTDVNTVTYNGDGSTTAFPFTFKIQDASEINLQLVQDDDTVTDITSDFYVDTVNSTVYYPGYAPGAEPPEADQPPKVQTGQKLTIWRDVPMTQENDLGDKWPFHEIEDGLDKLTMIAQQIFSYTNRKLDAALASMFQLAGIVTDSGKLQHITDQLNSIDANAAAALDSENSAIASAAAAAESEENAAASATAAANSAEAAETAETALVTFLQGKETITAPAVDTTLTVTGAAADAKVVGDKIGITNLSYTITSNTRVFQLNYQINVGDVIYVQVSDWNGTTTTFSVRDGESNIIANLKNVGDSAFIKVPFNSSRILFVVDTDSIAQNPQLSVIVKKINSSPDLSNLLLNSENNLLQICLSETSLKIGTDLNDIKENVFARIVRGFNYVNLPTDAGNNPSGIFSNNSAYSLSGAESFQIQRFFCFENNGMYTRFWNNTEWSDWVKIINNQNVSSLLDKFPFTVETIVESTNNRITTINKTALRGQKIFISPVEFDSQLIPATIIIRAYQDENNYVNLGTLSGIGGIFTCTMPFDAIKFTVGFSTTALSEATSRTILFAIYNAEDESLTERSPLRGKYISILGASMSTFEGYIPDGNSVYYPHETSNPNPVTDVHDTYWMKTIDALGLKLLINNSSAGSFCTTGHGSASDQKAGCGDRCEALDDGIHVPDIIVIQLGANDFTRNTTIGTYDGTSATFPTDTTTFREAYAVMLQKITTKYPSAKVYCGTIPMCSGGAYISHEFPPKNGNGTPLETYNKAIRDIASLFGLHVWEINKCGITFQNTYKYMQDYISASNYGQHPNKFGQSLFANELIKTLDASCKTLYTTTF